MLMPGAPEIAASILAECQALPVQNTPSLRLVRRKYTRLLQVAPGDLLLQIARLLRQTARYGWFGYELVRAHPAAFKRLDAAELEELGQGLDSWWTVDAFARTLSGPAWLEGSGSGRRHSRLGAFAGPLVEGGRRWSARWH